MSVLAVLAAACLESSTKPPTVVSIQLTAAQAAALNSRIQAIVSGSSDVAWLADSANLVLKEGAVVDSAAIVVSFGGGPYYAVSLQRHFPLATNPFSTFDVIYFNDPSNPTRFVILSAFAKGNVGPPDGVVANIATPTTVVIANAHLYAIEGQAVTHWRATAGSLVMGNGLPGGACPSFSAPDLVRCDVADLLIGAEVTATTRETGTAEGSPTLTVQDGLVRGIKLTFPPPPE
jgi:hypothetical protein